MNKKEDYVIKKKWNLKLRVFIGMLILTLINFLIFNDIYFLHDDAEGSFIYCRTIIILEFILILVFISRFCKRYDIYDICLSFLFCFAVLNFIMNKVYSKFFYDKIKYESHQLQSGKIINRNYIRGGSSITLSLVDREVFVPIKDRIEKYEIGSNIVFGKCKKYHYNWIEYLTLTNDTCIKYLFPKKYVKGKCCDSINNQFIENFFKEKGIYVIYKANVIESDKNFLNLKLQFKNYLSDYIIVSYKRKNRNYSSTPHITFFELYSNKEKSISKERNDTLLLYENIDKEIDCKYIVDENINTPENWAKITDYGYIFNSDVYAKEEIENYYPQIKQYVEKFKERNKQ